MNRALLQETIDQPRILIVDDDEPSALALELYLQRQGYAAQTAFSGAQALDAVENFLPHLVILDLMMPDISGLEVAQRLRNDPQQPYLPIIMITAQDKERRRLQSVLSGADDYLAKPVNELELLVRVQALLRTKAHLDRLWEENLRLLRHLETRNQELEAALEEVEAANLLKQNILNAVSHEMGTPMLQVKSAVHLLLEDVLKLDPDNRPASLLPPALARLEATIENFTDLARSENLRLDTFVLRDASEAALRQLERSWADKLPPGRIRQDFAPDVPPLYGDRRAVQRILQILLDNALKFDLDGGPVTLNVVRNGRASVRVSVIDQGMGIPKAQQERIFDEFYQVDSSTTRRVGGSGLGLALARLLAERMETRITVQSEPGQGSTFAFELPVAVLDD
ncbi:MAG: ATP-binding protein [Anaerolineales bacterium]